LAGVPVMFSLPRLAGLGIFALAVIWALLAIPKRGVLRKYWDSKPAKTLTIEYDDHRFGVPNKNGFAQAIEGESLMLRVDVVLHAIPNMLVESVKLEIKGRRLSSNWEPSVISVGVRHGYYAYFGIPKSVKAGKQKVKLVAFADGKDWFSGDFIVEFPKQN
jgi:hypothetical protein